MTKDEALKLALEVLEEGVQGTRPLGVATLENITAIKEALAEQEQCRHRIADARNKVVKDGYICVDCGALFSAADHNEAQPEQEPDGVALTNISHSKGAPAPDELNANALEVVELELPDEDEAVGWADGGVINWIAGKQFKHASYLYTTPPQRKPLTDEEVNKLVDDEDWYNDPHGFARAIEAAHGIKGEA